MNHIILALMILLAPLAGALASAPVTYTYDSQGRVSQAVYVNGSTTQTVTYSYDAAGNRTTVVVQ